SVPAEGKQRYLTTDSSITRVVRKDNTILYKANRYSVPLGTYSSFSKEVQLHIQEKVLSIVDQETKEIIGLHEISDEKGKLIQDRKHKRDRSKGIKAYTENIASRFDDTLLAHQYLSELKRKYPRYVRDQLQLINKQWDQFSSNYINDALRACM